MPYYFIKQLNNHKMNQSLRYISISHKTASVKQREVFHIPLEKKSDYTQILCNTFPDIDGLLLLTTCNRTEVYFETRTHSATSIRDYLIDLKLPKSSSIDKNLFEFSDSTESTVKHLLEVSSGLESSVLGDSEIIHQIKKSYQFSMTHKLQGSLLERAIQSVFKSHKRISNETNFRDGTTSVAYKSLKVIQNNFKNASSKTKKILFIGAGDIVKQLFKYNSKFNYSNIYISNRSKEKAMILAQKNKCKTFPWANVLANKLDDFEVIISAVSNCSNLIHNLTVSNHNVLLLDLAVPCNIDKSLMYQNNVMFHDLDSISKELEENKEMRIASKSDVINIIVEELTTYNEWLNEAPLRALLANLKISINKVVTKQFQPNIEDTQIKLVTNEVMKKLINQKETLALLPENELNKIISDEASLLINNL